MVSHKIKRPTLNFFTTKLYEMFTEKDKDKETKVIQHKLTGNIYKDVFYFEEKYYYNYSIDCVFCGIEVPLNLTLRKKSKTIARQLGWIKYDNKWVCPNCKRQLHKGENNVY